MKLNFTDSFAREIVVGFSERRIWTRLAKMAIDTQYKQNTLGPLWISANTAVLVFAFAIVYGQILKVELLPHLLYVASGIICWYLYSSILTKGCSAFIVARQLILQLPLPLSVHVYRLVFQEMIIFAYNLVVLLVIFIISGGKLSLSILIVVPAFALIMINGFLACFLCAIVATRYRDVASSMQALVAPLMFLTPIVWSARDLTDRPIFITLNPFFHIIEIWRSPILGTKFPIESWLWVLSMTLFLLVAVAVLFKKYRDRIVFWL